MRAEAADPEHFVTFFDRRFLLQGLALHGSLRRRQPGAVLWVLCLDREVEVQLRQLRLAGVRPLGLEELETPELRAARANRSATDYIFTLTPFVFDFVFARDPSVRRLTYVDADVYFFASPARLLHELERSGRSVLVTEHGFGPSYAHLTAEFGRFCVQFLPVNRSPGGLRVVRHWQRQCLDNCSTDSSQRSRVYGDQKYLDDWPRRYPDEVLVSAQRDQLLAPWNVDHYQGLRGRRYAPVLYHFHSFRLLRRGLVQLCTGFNPQKGRHLYGAYLAALRRQQRKVEAAGLPPPPAIPISGRWGLTRLAWRCLTGRAQVCSFAPRRGRVRLSAAAGAAASF